VAIGSSGLADALRNRYVLERELGRGGIATVWFARDLKHERPVAIKVLRAELSAILGAERFLREIRLTANLQHLISLSPTFTLLGRDTVLSGTTFQGDLGGFFSGSYQPTRDARRFLAIVSGKDNYQLVVSPNWITELRRRVLESGGRK
jgi:serine/threonine protein kinase